MIFFGVTVVFFLIFYIQGLPLIRQKKWGAFYVFIGIFMLAGYMAYGEVLGFLCRTLFTWLNGFLIPLQD